jgi:hypothetical protein
MIDSLAHWEGLQPYTDEITARGNIVGGIYGVSWIANDL